MSDDAKNHEGEMPALPKEFLEQFRCVKCNKYLRPPIKTVCNKGHNVCGICIIELGTHTYGIRQACPIPGGCQRVLDDIEAVAVETMIKVSNIKCMCNSTFLSYPLFTYVLIFHK